MIPEINFDYIHHINHFFVENIHRATQFISFCEHPKRREIVYEKITKNNDNMKNVIHTLSLLKQPHSWAILSDVGCPCIADPGQYIVMLAYEIGREVIPLVGPSSIFLAVMSSGFRTQKFCFQGYLFRSSTDRRKKIIQLEKQSQKEDMIYIFIETPHRAHQTFVDFLKFCSPMTMLGLSVDIGTANQYIFSQSIDKWNETNIHLHKRQVIFLLYCGPSS